MATGVVDIKDISEIGPAAPEGALPGGATQVIVPDATGAVTIVSDIENPLPDEEPCAPAKPCDLDP